MLLLLLAPVAMADDAPTGDAHRGNDLYRSVGCWQCHGTTGAGGGWQGPRLAPAPLPFVAFANQLRKPRAQMPHYPARLLTDQDVADIYAYVRSIPAGRPASQIDVLKR